MWPMRRMPAMESVYSANAVSRSPSDHAASPSSACAAAGSSVVVRCDREHACERASTVAAMSPRISANAARYISIAPGNVARAAPRRRRSCRTRPAPRAEAPATARPRRRSVDAIEVDRSPTSHADEADGEHGPDCARRRRGGSRTHARSVASCRPRRRPRAARSSARSAARSRSPAASACRIASDGSPCAANQALARRCSSAGASGILVEEPGAQHVGEEVVIPVPLASIVERDHEQVLALQRFERRLPAGRTGHRVAQRTLQPIEDRRLQHEAPHGFRLALQHLARQVVDDEAVVAREARR